MGAKGEPRFNIVAGPEGRPLTQREMQVIYRLTGGDTYREVAKHLGITVETTRNHVTSIRAKLGARNTAHACVLWMGSVQARRARFKAWYKARVSALRAMRRRTDATCNGPVAQSRPIPNRMQWYALARHRRATSERR